MAHGVVARVDVDPETVVGLHDLTGCRLPFGALVVCPCEFHATQELVDQLVDRDMPLVQAFPVVDETLRVWFAP